MFGLMRITVSKGQGALVDTHRAHGREGGETVFAQYFMSLINSSIFLSFLEETVQYTIPFLTVN